MMLCLNSYKLYQIRHSSYSDILRHFNRNSKTSKWSSFSKKADNVTSASNCISSNVGLSKLFKPFVFTVSFSGCCFLTASIWQYEDMRRKANNLLKSAAWFDQSHLPTYKRGEIRRQINALWHSQSEGQKVASVIICINLCVFLLWRIPPLYPVMRKYFSANPAMNATCLPMILSVFSHYSFFHFAANMYVLYSFSSSAVQFFGKEQFMALYGSAGVVSTFASYVHKVVTGRFVTSLGASGALMAVLSSICFEFPDAKLSIMFLPFFTFTAGSAIKAVMALDLVGLIAKWKLFDHAAHLGGAIFGIIYLYYGREYIWGKREHIFAWYRKLRERDL